MTAPPGGFPDGARAVPVPDLLFRRDLAGVADPLELRALLWMLWRVARRPAGSPAAIRRADAEIDETLSAVAAALGIPADRRRAAIGAALDALVGAGRLLAAPVAGSGAVDGERWLLVNDRAGREAHAALAAGRARLPDLAPAPAPRPDDAPGALGEVVALYEANIGLVTPLLAEALAEAAEAYPVGWVADALREAVANNARRWSYVRAILERWAREGRTEDGDEGDRGGARGSRRRDSEGPYAEWVRR